MSRPTPEQIAALMESPTMDIGDIRALWQQISTAKARAEMVAQRHPHLNLSYVIQELSGAEEALSKMGF